MSVQIKVTIADSVLEDVRRCADHRGLTLSEYAKLAIAQLARRDVSAASRGKTTPDATKLQGCTVCTLPGQI